MTITGGVFSPDKNRRNFTLAKWGGRVFLVVDVAGAVTLVASLLGCGSDVRVGTESRLYGSSVIFVAVDKEALNELPFRG